MTRSAEDARTVSTRRAWVAAVAASGAAAATLLVLDLTWLGVIARALYDSSLGALRRPQILWPAAALFYTIFVVTIVVYAVRGATSTTSAARRGAGLGLVTYATYELTNWATLAAWPARLVPVDIAWGIALTSAAATAGRLVYARVRGPARL